MFKEILGEWDVCHVCSQKWSVRHYVSHQLFIEDVDWLFTSGLDVWPLTYESMINDWTILMGAVYRETSQSCWIYSFIVLIRVMPKTCFDRVRLSNGRIAFALIVTYVYLGVHVTWDDWVLLFYVKSEMGSLVDFVTARPGCSDYLHYLVIAILINQFFHQLIKNGFTSNICIGLKPFPTLK